MIPTAIVLRNTVSGGRRRMGKYATNASTSPSTAIPSSSGTSKATPGHPSHCPSSSAPNPPAITSSPCAKFTAPVAFSTSTNPSASSA